MTGESSKGKDATGPATHTAKEIDEVVEMKDSIHVGTFQTEISKGSIVRAPVHDTHVMVAPIRHAEVERGKVHPLPPGLQVLHACTTLMTGSKQVSIVVRNMTDSVIFLKKGACVVHVISATLVPPEEAPLEQAEGKQVPRGCMSVQE